ncbi:hypothetical protein EC988_000308 [Linderina pennispora]|nr:hypothetical protein EC988_000308 [Linderina pennispora]
MTIRALNTQRIAQYGGQLVSQYSKANKPVDRRWVSTNDAAGQSAGGMANWEETPNIGGQKNDSALSTDSSTAQNSGIVQSMWAAAGGLKDTLDLLGKEVQDSLQSTASGIASRASIGDLGSAKDKLRAQATMMQTSLASTIAAAQGKIDGVLQGMLPPQLQRPWIDSSARLFINKEIYPEIEHTPIIRQGKDICANEERYQKVRTQKMHKDFAEFIGVPASSIDPRDIPVIGVAGSGGGFRAMVSTIGSLRAMYKAGLYQCTMYEAAVSGSSWALAALHTYADGNPHLVLDNLRLAMRENMFSMTSLISFVSRDDDVAKQVFSDMAARYMMNTAKGRSVPAEDSSSSRQQQQQQQSANGCDLEAESDDGRVNWSIEDLRVLFAQTAEIGATHAVPQRIKDDAKVLAMLAVGELVDAAYRAMQTVPAPPFSIVELYGALLFKQLIVHHEKRADTETTHLDPHWVKMSAQAKRVESGDQPMPIYTAVRHYVNRSVFADSTSRHEYQWFEFSPFEFGSAEHGLWVPAWGLGRPMADGEELFKLGEMHFGSIMGAVSSAFCASIKAMLMEIYLVAPASLRSAIGQLLNRYDHDTSVSHPIPPYTMFNPFRRDTSRSSDPRCAELQEHNFLSLMDAGMDNNLPFAPLLRPERNVDVIICLDSSANIELMSWFSRAERWAEQNGVTRWPWGARPWKAEPLLSDASSQSSFATYAARDAAQRTEENMVENNSRCAVFDKPVAPSPFRPTIQPTISVIYLPLLPNSSFTDPEFDPATADFCATFNAQWKPEQVDKLADLTSANFEQELERIRMAIKDAYLKKKAYREYLERYG